MNKTITAVACTGPVDKRHKKTQYKIDVNKIRLYIVMLIASALGRHIVIGIVLS